MCDLHLLLLSCPAWLRLPVRLVTRRLHLGHYRFFFAAESFLGLFLANIWVNNRSVI